MAAPPPRRPTIEVGTEPAAGEPVATSVIEVRQPAPVEAEWLYFCANPDHPGLAQFGLKDPNQAPLRAFTSPVNPLDPNERRIPVCPVCERQVNAYPIEKEGDIPEAVQRAPY